MSNRPSRGRAKFVAVQALWGMTLLTAPGGVLRVLGGADEDRTPKRIMRVLGARHLLQATAEHVFGETTLEVGALVDGLHALTGYGFACADARWRRAALADAVITTGFAAVGLSEIRTGSKIAPS